MTTRRAKRDHIKNAAQAHTDLNMFYACISLMEGGHVSAESYTDQQRLIAMCRNAAARCLRRYDTAVLKAGGAAYGELMPEGK